MSLAGKHLGNKVGWVREACGQESEPIQTEGPVPEGAAMCPLLQQMGRGRVFPSDEAGEGKKPALWLVCQALCARRQK